MAPQKKQNIMVGKWVPSDREAVMKWALARLERIKKQYAKQYAAMKEFFPDTHSRDEQIQEFVKSAGKFAEIAKRVQLLPPVMELLAAMATEPEVCMVMVDMFNQQDVHHWRYPMNIRDFLFVLNTTIREAPTFVDDDSNIQIPVPVGCLLTYVMGTPAGFACFIKKRINELFKKILDNYGEYLMTKDSTNVLSDTKGGWFTEAALEEMPDFVETFNCHPNLPHYGYTSFDNFFTRTLKDGARPLGGSNDPLIIANACENAPYKVSYTVQRHDAFWIKSQPYSLQYVLDNDPNLHKFVGGTVYQGFLSPHTYHRFHSPVSGTVVTAKVVNGTYFSQPYFMDGSANYIASQPYLAHVATRGIIIIDTKHKDIGLVAFVPIGMVDVSSVDLSISKNAVVEKGQNIGTFHFGGSSHLVIFEKGVQVAFDLQGIVPDPNGNEFLKVRTKLGTVVPQPKVVGK